MSEHKLFDRYEEQAEKSSETEPFEPSSIQSSVKDGFEDVYGVESQIETLRQHVVTPIEAGAQVTDIVYFEGSDGSGKTTLAKATAGELNAYGYSLLHVDSYPEDGDEFRSYVSTLITEAREHEPTVIFFEEFGRVAYHEDIVESLVETVRNSDEAVLILAELHESGHKVPLPVPDFTVELPAYDPDRRRGLVEDCLATFETEAAFHVDLDSLDFDALVNQLSWYRSPQFDWLPAACKAEAYQQDADYITQGIVECAIADRKATLERFADRGTVYDWSFEAPPDLEFDDVCELDDQVDKLRRTVVQPLEDHPDAASQLIYFDGQSQSGKTWLAKATAGELDADEFSYVHLDCSEEEYRSSTYVQSVFERARARSPSVVIFEDFDLMMNRNRDEIRHAIEKLRTCEEIVLIFAELAGEEHTGSFSRHERELPRSDTHIRLPNDDDNRNIALLRQALGTLQDRTGFDVAFTEIDFEALVVGLKWCRPADYERLASRARLNAIQDDAERITQETLEQTTAELEEECENDPTHPHSSDSDGGFGSSHSDETDRFYVEDSDVTFDNVGGLDDVIQRIREVTIYPQEHPELFEKTNLEQTSGVLLHGPPGNGKTLLARALANELDRTFLSVRGPELKNKWFGESERRVRELFEVADEEAPSLIFFDEFDAIAPNRSGCTSSPTTSVVNMLLTEMDGLEERGDIVFIAATNRKDAIDQAALRPGRLGETIEITPPEAAGRGEIFDIHTAGLPLQNDVTGEWFSDVTSDGLSGAEIEAVCRRAVHKAISDDGSSVVIAPSHVTAALNAITE